MRIALMCRFYGIQVAAHQAIRWLWGRAAVLLSQYNKQHKTSEQPQEFSSIPLLPFGGFVVDDLVGIRSSSCAVPTGMPGPHFARITHASVHPGHVATCRD